MKTPSGRHDELKLASVFQLIDVIGVVTESWGLSIDIFVGLGQGRGRQRRNMLMMRYQLRWCQCIIVVERFGYEWLHDWFSHEVEVLEHLVGAPSTKDFDDVGVKLGDQ